MSPIKGPASIARLAESEFWFGPNGASGRISHDIAERLAWGDATDPLFQEYVAQAHLDAGANGER
ncbi:hypothetical protein [Sorangium sp. So ce124]|uniref:hypothetical protein n=1 Tax=Sorangium sp. So ce124 TaxID=3133280 RepID=UPI003F5FAD85